MPFPTRSIDIVLLALAGVTAAGAEPINPVPRAMLATQLTEWSFDGGADGWLAENNCQLTAETGRLHVEVTSEDPYFHAPVKFPGGQFLLRIRARARTSGTGAVYWTTGDSPRGENQSARFGLKHDGQWREYEARFVVAGTLTDLRLDPGDGPGQFDIDWMQLVHEEPHPLTIDGVETTAGEARFLVRNHRDAPIEFSAMGRPVSLAGRDTVSVAVPLPSAEPLQAVSLELVAAGLPPVRRSVFVHLPSTQTEWVVRQAEDFTLRAARSGRLARIERNGELLAILGPLVHCRGQLPELRLVQEEPALRWEGEGIEVELRTAGREIHVAIRGSQRCTGPVVRVMGGLEQGLFAGLEYLGKGESSSSTIDVETAEHLRFAPDPINVTLPLTALVTDSASVAMTWTDMRLQPLFATPNFFDTADDHCLALEGEKIDCTLRIDRSPLEEIILWAVRKRGLAPLPEPPRTADEQMQLCLRALTGPLKTAEGWGHCVEENWARHPYASMASTVWKLTGEVPQLTQLVPGGTHIDNDAVYFLTGRADQWRQRKSGEMQEIIKNQQPDGSFRYAGPFRRGHFEDTASGVCARPAAELLEHAWLTGDKTSLQAGLRTLEFMKRFRTPRGAQVWEVPLHTPDLLASANLVLAYVRGYELTGNREYLQIARKWALSGIPFVYQWSRDPIMAYGTPPVFGSTHWRGTCWIGRPVQWVGGVYAYALAKFAPYDDSLDWKHLARGILIAAEQMQYPDGPFAGLLPDAFDLASQSRVPAKINPCALVSLRLVLDGKLDSLAVTADGKHRVVAPFPISLREGKAHVQGQPGVTYQVLVDGQRIIDVHSSGEDVVIVD